MLAPGRVVALAVDLLTLARGDAGQPLTRRPVALDPLLLDVYRPQLPLAEEVNLVLGDFDQVTVEGDPDRLRQFVRDLVDNALRFAPAGGTVFTVLLPTRRDQPVSPSQADPGESAPGGDDS